MELRRIVALDVRQCQKKLPRRSHRRKRRSSFNRRTAHRAITLHVHPAAQLHWLG